MMLVWLAALLVGPVHAQDRKSVDFNFEEPPDGFGAGFVIGEPTGLSLAWRNAERNAIQTHFGFSAANTWFHLNVDYLHNVVIYDSPDMPGVVWPVYVGIGGRVWAGGSWYRGGKYLGGSGFGLRVPVGISMLPRRLAVDVFIEGVPVLLLYPYTRGYLDFGLGARIYF